MLQSDCAGLRASPEDQPSVSEQMLWRNSGLWLEHWLTALPIPPPQLVKVPVLFQSIASRSADPILDLQVTELGYLHLTSL